MSITHKPTPYLHQRRAAGSTSTAVCANRCLYKPNSAEAIACASRKYFPAGLVPQHVTVRKDGDRMLYFSQGRAAE